MRSKQQGMTAISFLVLAALVTLIMFAGLKLTPIYLEHMKIVSVLNDVKGELDGQNASATSIRNSIAKRLNVEMVNIMKPQDFEIRKTEEGYEVRAQYEHRASYLANISLVGEFNDAVVIRR